MHLQTPRLSLSTLTGDEWAAVASLEAADWAPDYPTSGDLLVAQLIMAGEWPADEWGPLQIRSLADGLAIGGIGCKGAPDESGRVEIGYGLAESARGKGYASEAVIGLLGWLRDQGVREVMAECDDANTASIAVLRRCGFGAFEASGGVTMWSRLLSPA